MSIFNTWKEQREEIKRLFIDNVILISTIEPGTSETIVLIVDELESNVQKYIANPELIGDFLKENNLSMKDVSKFQYLLGASALLDLAFYNKNTENFLTKEEASKVWHNQNTEDLESTLVSIRANVDTLRKFEANKPRLKP